LIDLTVLGGHNPHDRHERALFANPGRGGPPLWEIDVKIAPAPAGGLAAPLADIRTKSLDRISPEQVRVVVERTAVKRPDLPAIEVAAFSSSI
jgi:hypothetical protein